MVIMLQVTVNNVGDVLSHFFAYFNTYFARFLCARAVNCYSAY